MMSAIKDNHLSKIGLGTYRFLDRNHPQNIEALAYAVENNCNFIDTASTYGDAELLIGDYIHSSKKEITIATKAGYLSESIFENNSKLLAKLSKHDKVNLREVMHCIHPDFLELQIKKSSQNLKKESVDIFYIHSPENYLIHLSPSDANQNIINGFEKLEELVSKGKIKSYGISSNLFLIELKFRKEIGINLYIDILNEHPEFKNFKYIQCPFNLLENNPLDPLRSGLNMIDTLHSKGLKFVSNRPFLIHSDKGVIKIQDYKKITFTDLDYSETNKVLDSLIKKLQIQLSISDDTSILEFPICKLIYENWAVFGNKSAVDEIFMNQFYEFINVLYDNNIPDEVNSNLDTLYSLFLKIALKNELETSKSFILNYYNTTTYKNINYKVCKEYLSYGVDHVLVGMNKREYVTQLKSLF